VWQVERTYKKRMSKLILTVPQILERLDAAHEKYLAHERHNRSEETIYWKGRWEGIRDLFNI